MFNSCLSILTLTILFGQNYTPVPVNYSIPILFKVIAYNRTIFQGPKKTVEIVILYNSDSRKSRKQKKQILKSFETILEKKLRKKKINIHIKDVYQANIDSIFTQQSYDVIFTVELDIHTVTKISKFAKKLKIMSFSTNPNDLKYGISISCLLQNNDRPKIIADYKSLILENVNLHPQILKLSRLVNKNSRKDGN